MNYSAARFRTQVAAPGMAGQPPKYFKSFSGPLCRWGLLAAGARRGHTRSSDDRGRLGETHHPWRDHATESVRPAGISMRSESPPGQRKALIIKWLSLESNWINWLSIWHLVGLTVWPEFDPSSDSIECRFDSNFIILEPIPYFAVFYQNFGFFLIFSINFINFLQFLRFFDWFLSIFCH